MGSYSRGRGFLTGREQANGHSGFPENRKSGSVCRIGRMQESWRWQLSNYYLVLQPMRRDGGSGRGAESWSDHCFVQKQRIWPNAMRCVNVAGIAIKLAKLCTQPAACRNFVPIDAS